MCTKIQRACPECDSVVGVTNGVFNDHGNVFHGQCDGSGQSLYCEDGDCDELAVAFGDVCLCQKHGDRQRALIDFAATQEADL